MAKAKDGESEAPEPGAYPKLLWNAETGEEITVRAPSEDDAKQADGYVEAPPDPPEVTPLKDRPELGDRPSHPIAGGKPRPEQPIVKPTPEPHKR